jgi:hypothetical protein
VLFATNEFEKLWAEGVDILPSIAQQSLEKTHLSDNITPYELYLKDPVMTLLVVCSLKLSGRKI